MPDRGPKFQHTFHQGCDGPSQRSRLISEFLAEQRYWLDVRWLPAYAPELNPVEGLWANLNGRELANRCEAQAGADRVRADRAVHLPPPRRAAAVSR